MLVQTQVPDDAVVLRVDWEAIAKFVLESRKDGHSTSDIVADLKSQVGEDQIVRTLDFGKGRAGGSRVRLGFECGGVFQIFREELRESIERDGFKRPSFRFQAMA